ncbi:MAG TPA: glycosyltransferase family 4 protein [Armatimonadota bacterium]|jgi:glycosyltransferase involved in cell wall biosynthesis
MYGVLTGDNPVKVGGAEVQLKLVAAALRKLGHDVTFIVPDVGQPDRVVTESGMEVVKVPMNSRYLPGVRFCTRIVRFLRTLSDVRADVYCQMMRGMCTGLVAYHCKRVNRPFVFSVASNIDVDYSLPDWIEAQERLLFRYGISRADAVVVQSADQMALVRSNLHKEAVLIPSTFSMPDPNEDHGAGDMILWAANMREVKRPEMFVDLAERLPQYSFVMVGGFDSGNAEAVEAIRRRAELLSNLQLTGFVPYDEVGRYFSRAALFVNTSWAEGFPNTFLQSWCRGVPVIATFDSDGLLSREGLGRYCADLDELAASVDEFMKDAALRSSVGETAKNYVMAHHSPDAVSAEFDRLFSELMWDSPPVDAYHE